MSKKGKYTKKTIELGGSVYVIIPKDVCDICGIKISDTVEIEVKKVGDKEDEN